VLSSAGERAAAMRSEVVVHPATLGPSEREYAEGYRSIMDRVRSRMRPGERAGGGGGRRERYEDPD